MKNLRYSNEKARGQNEIYSQIGMHHPPEFHLDSRWTPDKPHGVSGVHLPDSSVDSTWTQSRFNPPGIQEESV